MAAQSGIRDQASKAAIDWFIRLQDDPDDPRLRAGFAAWLTESPEHASAWRETAATFALIGETAKSASGEIVDLAQARRTRLLPRSSRRAVVFGAAALAASLVAVLLPNLLLAVRADYATATAEQRQVRLADGTVVELGPRSAIAVDYNGGGRVVRLLAGRAFFSVTHDPARPFSVEAGRVRTTDLGTEFDIALQSGATSVSLERGSIRVEYRHAGTAIVRTLEPGERMRVPPGGGATDEREAPERMAAWRDGRVIAADRPASEVVEALRPYYPGLIVVADDLLAGQRITGVYDLHDPVSALRALADAHGQTVHQLSPWLLVLTGR